MRARRRWSGRRARWRTRRGERPGYAGADGLAFGVCQHCGSAPPRGSRPARITVPAWRQPRKFRWVQLHNWAGLLRVRPISPAMMVTCPWFEPPPSSFHIWLHRRARVRRARAHMHAPILCASGQPDLGLFACGHLRCLMLAVGTRGGLSFTIRTSYRQHLTTDILVGILVAV